MATNIGSVEFGARIANADEAKRQAAAIGDELEAMGDKADAGASDMGNAEQQAGLLTSQLDILKDKAIGVKSTLGGIFQRRGLQQGLTAGVGGAAAGLAGTIASKIKDAFDIAVAYALVKIRSVVNFATKAFDKVAKAAKNKIPNVGKAPKLSSTIFTPALSVPFTDELSEFAFGGKNTSSTSGGQNGGGVPDITPDADIIDNTSTKKKSGQAPPRTTTGGLQTAPKVEQEITIQGGNLSQADISKITRQLKTEFERDLGKRV